MVRTCSTSSVSLRDRQKGHICFTNLKVISDSSDAANKTTESIMIDKLTRFVNYLSLSSGITEERYQYLIKDLLAKYHLHTPHSAKN